MVKNNMDSECNCGIPREEKVIEINRIPVKALVCPKCGYTIFSAEELQVYFNKLYKKLER